MKCSTQLLQININKKCIQIQMTRMNLVYQTHAACGQCSPDTGEQRLKGFLSSVMPFLSVYRPAAVRAAEAPVGPDAGPDWEKTIGRLGFSHSFLISCVGGRPTDQGAGASVSLCSKQAVALSSF